MGDMTNQELQSKSSFKQRKSIADLLTKANLKAGEKNFSFKQDDKFTEALNLPKKSPLNLGVRSASNSPSSRGGHHMSRKQKKQEALQLAQNEIESLKVTI